MINNSRYKKKKKSRLFTPSTQDWISTENDVWKPSIAENEMKHPQVQLRLQQKTPRSEPAGWSRRRTRVVSGSMKNNNGAEDEIKMKAAMKRKHDDIKNNRGDRQRPIGRSGVTRKRAEPEDEQADKNRTSDFDYYRIWTIISKTTTWRSTTESNRRNDETRPCSSFEVVTFAREDNTFSFHASYWKAPKTTKR